MKRLLKLFILFLLINSYSFAETENIQIPCNIKECNPKFGYTYTKWYKGDKTKPAIIWFGGGKSDYTQVSGQPISNLVDKFDIIMVASPIAIDSKNREGYPYNAYVDWNVYRMKQVTEHYKKLLNKPIWLGGISAGGPRMIGILIGSEKDRPSDNYAGLIFSSPYVSKYHQGQATLNMPLYRIKYKMNLPILIFQHARDHKGAQHPAVQKRFRDQLAKYNSSKTELVLTTEGDPKITTYDGPGSHHWFATNKDEVARLVSKFILDNTK